MATNRKTQKGLLRRESLLKNKIILETKPDVTFVTMTKISEEKKPEIIQAMFGKIASRYDLANGVLSFQLHKLWNRRLVNTLTAKESLLDICTGTGEIAYRWLSQQKSPKAATLLDFCGEMLEEAKKKSAPFLQNKHDLKFIQADATSLPLDNQSMDAVSVAYGIRNIQQPQKCFEEVFRVLKPSGQFSILELTEPKFSVLKHLHQFYLNKVLPFIGGLLTNEKNAYRYLSSSVQSFTCPADLKKQLLACGFSEVNVIPLTGGIATLILAKKT